MAKQSSKTQSVTFCKRQLSFTQAQVEAKLSRLADDRLARVNRYYVPLPKGRKANITDVLAHMANLPLVWRTGRTGNLVGTYSTMQAMRVLVRLGIHVCDSTTGKRIPLAQVMGARKTTAK